MKYFCIHCIEYERNGRCSCKTLYIYIIHTQPSTVKGNHFEGRLKYSAYNQVWKGINPCIPTAVFISIHGIKIC